MGITEDVLNQGKYFSIATQSCPLTNKKCHSFQIHQRPWLYEGFIQIRAEALPSMGNPAEEVSSLHSPHQVQVQGQGRGVQMASAINTKISWWHQIPHQVR